MSKIKEVKNQAAKLGEVTYSYELSWESRGESRGQNQGVR